MAKTFNQEFRRLNPNLTDSVKGISVNPRSSSYISPGDVYYFKYKNEVGGRLVLIVSNKRGDGIFLSNPGNKLVSCFHIDGNSQVIIEALNILYKNRRKASYKVATEGLSALLGRERYRTFNLRHMHDLREISLNLR